MIRADRELLAELARMNSDVAPLAMRIMDDSATRDEQQALAERLIELGTRLSHRARLTRIVIDGDTGTSETEEFPQGHFREVGRATRSDPFTSPPATSTSTR